MSDCRKFVYHILTALFVTKLFYTVVSAQSCKFTNIHLVNEHGQEQVLTFQEPTNGPCGCQSSQGNTVQTCPGNAQMHSRVATDSNTPSPKQQSPDSTNAAPRQLVYSTGADGLPYPANRIPEVPFRSGGRTLHLSPTVTVFIGDIITNICNLRTSESDSEMCNGLKKLSACLPDGSGTNDNRELVEKYASYLVENKLLPVPTGDFNADTRIAYGLVLLGANLIDEAVEYFTLLTKEYPNLASAYHGRGMAYARKGLVSKLANRAIDDFSKAAELEPSNPEHCLRRAELYIPLGRYDDAMQSVATAIDLDEDNSRAYFLKATLQFVVEDLKSAERNYRNSLTFEEVAHTEQTYYNLALTLYYRGMLRNSIEVFKDLIKKYPKNYDAHASLAHVYGQLGDDISAAQMFNKTLQLQGNHVRSHQLKGAFHFNNGDVHNALNDFQKCLSSQPENYVCQYLNAVTLTSAGQFYNGIKAFTKVLIHRPKPMKMSPEFIKAHYLREYARYLHRNLDEMLMDIDFDGDLPEEFKDKWMKTEPFQFKAPYMEQPGLSPATADVSTPDLYRYPDEVRELLCHARALGYMSEYSTDGFLQNQREEMAIGLAAVHIAQHMQDVWNDVGTSKTGPGITWKALFDIAVRYQRLVNAEEPVYWLDGMPEAEQELGYSHDLYIVRGHTINVRLMNYFDLVYKLVKTMVSVHCGEGEMYPEVVMHELLSVETYEEMIDVLKKDLFREQGYVMATQVPSIKDPKARKYEGVYLSISADSDGKAALAISLPYNKEKAKAIHAELDFIFYELYHEIRKLEGKSSEDPDHIISLILSLVYYFLNLSPLSHGTSAVAWSVILGLVMSVGRETTTRIGTGKLLEIEAAISGGPDTFSMVTKNWMNIKRMKKSPIPHLAKVSETFPTMRDVLEVLNIGIPDCNDLHFLAKNMA